MAIGYRLSAIAHPALRAASAFRPEPPHAWAAYSPAGVRGHSLSSRPPRHPLPRTTAGKPPSQRGHGTLRPRETDPGSTQHTDCRVTPTERTSDTGLAPSLVGLVNRVANESLLIVVRVIAALAAEDQRTGKPRMPELPVGGFTSRSEDKPGTLKLGHQLSDLARRDQKCVTLPPSASPIPSTFAPSLFIPIPSACLEFCPIVPGISRW